MVNNTRLDYRLQKKLFTPIVSQENSSVLQSMSFQNSNNVSKILNDFKGCFVKFMTHRTVPYIFWKQYSNFWKEFEVLLRMYSIDNKHVAQPIKMDSWWSYYTTKLYTWYVNFTNPSILTFSTLKTNKKLFIEVLDILKVFHEKWLAHGDILNNLLIKVDNNGNYVDWKIIDPVWIDNIDEHFEDAVKKDILDIEMVLNDSHLTKENIQNYSWTPILHEINPKLLIERSQNTTQVTKDSREKIISLLKNNWIEINKINNLYQIRKFAKNREETAIQFIVSQIELLADLIEKVTSQIDQNPFCDKEVLISDTIKNISNNDQLLISEDILTSAIESIHKYYQLMINAIRYLNINSEFWEENYIINWFKYVLVWNAICTIIKDKFSNYPWKEIFKEDYAAVADIIKYKDFPLTRMFIPENDFNYVIEHEKRHATINKAFNQELDINKLLNEEMSETEIINLKLKEEITAFLTMGISVSKIIDILSDEKWVYKFNMSNITNLNDIFSSLIDLSKIYDNKRLANILTIIPMNQWKKISKFIYYSKWLNNDIIIPASTPRM